MTYSDSTEAEHLTDILEEGDFDNSFSVFDDYCLMRSISKRNKRLLEQYHLAKSKKVGETFKCAYCGKKHVKKQYTQAFCPPNKAKQSKCKDMFHNSVDESRWRV
jgi:hypothetical protein